MSRPQFWATTVTLRAPRVSGDEPVTGDLLELLLECSPRERG